MDSAPVRPVTRMWMHRAATSASSSLRTRQSSVDRSGLDQMRGLLREEDVPVVGRRSRGRDRDGGPFVFPRRHARASHLGIGPHDAGIRG